VVWQKAMDLAVETYRLTKTFPREETYRMVSQMTRVGASVPANIAEGYARQSSRDYARFLAIAKGSLMELETYLMRAIRLEYLKDHEAQIAMGHVTEVSKMLASLRKKITERHI
jgi:four helix bundle protein